MRLIYKLLSLIILMGTITLGFLVWYQYDRFLGSPLNISAENSLVEIKKGSNFKQLTKQLREQNILQTDSEALLLRVHARLTETAAKIKAGEYQLEDGMKPDDMLQKFVSGQVLQYQMSIIDGETFKEIIADIKRHPQLEQTLTDDDYADIMQKLGAPADMKPEGWFFPDTYNFPRKTTDMEFLQRSYRQMQDYLQKAWEGREENPHIKTPYEALILASIVEKETSLPEERPLIARVFLNRLEKGMLLQTDPTVIYGIGDKYDGNIRKVDLKTDTPYNTYTRPGLPPTPIATPSKAAIDAVMHPAEGDVFYFVAKEPGGASHFSKTYQEHQDAVRQYILNRNKKAVN